MRYYIDTEFIEGFHKPLFGKRRHFIDLISIGIVASDGREYYAISNEFNPKDADDWVKENVIAKLPQKAQSIYDSPRLRKNCLLYKSNKQIAQDIFNFINPDLGFHVSAYNNSELKEGRRLYKHFEDHNVKSEGEIYVAQPEFYAYYADYDWVVFCSLFGRMIDLPKGFPMYCKDLKQSFDDKALLLYNRELRKRNREGGDIKGLSLQSTMDYLKIHKDYPRQENEHSALDDARWNMELHKFLQSL